MNRIVQWMSDRRPFRLRAPPATSPSWPNTKDLRTIFAHIHRSNHWGESESLSGPGSTLAYTENIREELPRLWEQLGTRIILDTPWVFHEHESVFSPCLRDQRRISPPFRVLWAHLSSSSHI